MKCRICGNDKDNQGYDVREMMFGHRDVFRYFQCARCECLQVESIPADISKYYLGTYYSYQDTASKIKLFIERLGDRHAFFGGGIAGKLIYAIFPNQALRSLRLLSIDKEASILDVGCGAGALLNTLREFGMKNLLGVDPFIERDIQYGNGVEIQKKKIHDIDGQFDVVMLHHSFEHIVDPAEVLNTVSKLLKPGGRCVIRIPVVSSYAWKHYGIDWIQIDAPRHFYLHSIESMNLLVDQAGLEVYQVIHDSTAFQFWGSEQYVKDIPLQDKRSFFVNPLKSIFSARQMVGFAKHAKELNGIGQGDQAAFYIRKRSA